MPKTATINLKEQNAIYTFKITIRDRTHFYSVVKWLNTHVGKGSDKWTMQGRVLRSLGNGEVTTTVYIFVQEFDIESSLYLNLL